MDSYSKSKLANVMFSVSLADKLSNRKNIKAVSLHPGIVASEFYNNGSCLLKFFKCCCCCMFVDNERGAMASLHTSRIEFSKLRSGAYYDDDTTIIEMNKIAQNRTECQ